MNGSKTNQPPKFTLRRSGQITLEGEKDDEAQCAPINPILAISPRLIERWRPIVRLGAPTIGISGVRHPKATKQIAVSERETILGSYFGPVTASRVEGGSSSGVAFAIGSRIVDDF